MVPIKQREEGGLCTCGPFDATKAEAHPHTLQAMDVHEELVCPHACSLAHSCQLSWPDRPNSYKYEVPLVWPELRPTQTLSKATPTPSQVNGFRGYSIIVQ